MEAEIPPNDRVTIALVHWAPTADGGDGVPGAVFAAEEGGRRVVEAHGVRVREQVQLMGLRLVYEVVPGPCIKGRLEVDGDAEEHEVGVGGDDYRL